MPSTLSPELRTAFGRLREARTQAQEARGRATQHAYCIHVPADPEVAVGPIPGRGTRPDTCALALDAWDRASAELEEAALALLCILRLD